MANKTVVKKYQMAIIDRPDFFKQRKRKYGDIYNAMKQIRKGKALRVSFEDKLDAQLAQVTLRQVISRRVKMGYWKKNRFTIYHFGEDLYITLRSDKFGNRF